MYKEWNCEFKWQHVIDLLHNRETLKTSSTILRVFEITPWAFLRGRVSCRWQVSALEVPKKIRHLSLTNRLTFLDEILLIARQLGQQCPSKQHKLRTLSKPDLSTVKFQKPTDEFLVVRQLENAMQT